MFYVCLMLCMFNVKFKEPYHYFIKKLLLNCKIRVTLDVQIICYWIILDIVQFTLDAFVSFLYF